MPSLTIKETDNETINTFIFSGAIDELAEFSSVKPTSDSIVFDFNGITAVNSMGVRKWVHLIASLKDKKIKYENCPIVIVEQLSVVRNLSQNVRVNSFQLPFGCDRCQTELTKTLLLEDFENSEFIEALNELYSCEKCRENLDFLDDEDIYFQFMK